MILRIRNAFRLTWDLILLPIAMVRLFLNPDNTNVIFQIGTFRRHRVFQLAKEKIMADAGMAKMVQEKFLHPGYYDLNFLGQMQEGTLGREYAKFMQAYKLDPSFFKDPNDPNEDDFVYMSRRGPQTHDIWHLMVGVPVTPLGEMKISAFYVAQLRSPFNALFIGIGLFVVLFKQPELMDDFFSGVCEGWTLGRNARPLFAMRWEEHWHRSLVELRRELNLPEAPGGVVKIPENFLEEAYARQKLHTSTAAASKKEVG